MGKKIEITKVEYDELIKAADFLDCLEQCGVDNWSGYEVAKKMMSEMEGVEDVY